jgi:hypothetical protein
LKGESFLAVSVLNLCVHSLLNNNSIQGSFLHFVSSDLYNTLRDISEETCNLFTVTVYESQRLFSAFSVDCMTYTTVLPQAAHSVSSWLCVSAKPTVIFLQLYLMLLTSFLPIFAAVFSSSQPSWIWLVLPLPFVPLRTTSSENFLL